MALSHVYQRSSEKELKLQEEQSLARQIEYNGVNH